MVTTIRFILASTLAGAVALVAVSGRAEPPGAKAPPDAAAIRRWIAELDHEHYVVRERAVARPISAGPAALEPLAVAADSPNLEVASHAVHVLLKLGDSADPVLSALALQRVAGLKNRPVEQGLAAAALAGIRQRRAIAELKKLGAEFISQGTFDERLPYWNIQLKGKWKGGDAGLVWLKDVPTLTNFGAYGVAITDAGLEHVSSATSLTQVELYGTYVTEQGAAQLRKAMVGAKVSLRQVFLGIQGNAQVKGIGALVTGVEAGSAAEQAGIKVQDMIIRFNGQQFEGFEGLTAFIAKCQVGEKVTLDVIREERPIQVEVTFGPKK